MMEWGIWAALGIGALYVAFFFKGAGPWDGDD